MKLRCLHGFFKIEEVRLGELSRFISRFGLNIQPMQDFYTFEPLVGAPRFSIKGLPYLEADTIKTFEGNPWEVMRENELVYNFNTGKVVLLSTVDQQIQLQRAGNFWVSNGLILPGSLTEDGQRVTDYAAWFSWETLSFKYSEVSVV